jgi:hypothetical protein
MRILGSLRGPQVFGPGVEISHPPRRRDLGIKKHSVPHSSQPHRDEWDTRTFTLLAGAPAPSHLGTWE